MELTISIVSHNNRSEIDLLIKDLEEKLVVSPGDSVNLILTTNTNEAEWCPRSKIFPIELTRNLRVKGFGENHNSAFERSNSDLFFIVNPDVKFLSTVDTKTIFTSLTEEGIYSPVIFNQFGKKSDYFRGEITIMDFLKRVLLRRNSPKNLWLTGAFLIVNRSLFRALGGFDQSFFMYGEDCDLCLRARALGASVRDTDVFSVEHVGRRLSSRNLNHLSWHLKSLAKIQINRLVLRKYSNIY